MKRCAFISDLHADVHALRDALTQIERLGCNLVVCVGDLVDEGRFPEETLAVLHEQKIPCIRGNHDRWAMRDGQDVNGWVLTPKAASFLESLPRYWEKTIEGVRVVVWHARPRSDMDGIYPDADDSELDSMLDRSEADVLVVGHTHLPLCLAAGGGRLVVNPGALLRDPAEAEAEPMHYDNEQGRFVPGSAAGGGTFGMLELPARRWTVHRASDGTEVPALGRVR